MNTHEQELEEQVKELTEEVQALTRVLRGRDVFLDENISLHSTIKVLKQEIKTLNEIISELISKG